jgi:hypothetical protein
MLASCAGVTSRFLALGAPLPNKTVASDQLAVALPDSNWAHSTHTGDMSMDLPQLPKVAQYCHVIPDLAKYSILSLVQLCEVGCEVSFKNI